MLSEIVIVASVIVCIIVGLVWLYLYKLAKQKQEDARLAAELERQREQLRLAEIEAERQRRQEFLNGLLPATREITRYMQRLQTGYLASFPYKQWQKKAKQLLSDWDSIRRDGLSIDSLDKDSIDAIVEFNKGGASMRRRHNAGIIEKDLIAYKTLFDEAAGKPLDEQQRRAVITDEDNNLIIAGAGSGKTTTIVGKVKYLMARYHVEPGRILLISFTRKSAKDLNDRVNVKGTVVKTFHSFGLAVVTQALGYRPSIADPNDFENRISLIFENRLKTDSAFQRKAVSFYLDGLKVERPEDDFKSRGEYIQYLKDQDFTTLKTVAGKGQSRLTLKREQVKSAEECKIANFLYLNNIEYHYESPYEHFTATLGHKQYRPDFTMKQGGRVVYLEHFGINKKGEVPRWFAKVPGDEYLWRVAQKDYVDGMEWKRKLHVKHGTTLIETFSHENDGRGKLLVKLHQKLRQAGIVLNPKSPEEVWQIIQSVDDISYKAIAKLMATFIVLMKSNNMDFAEVAKRVQAIKEERERERATYLCSLIKPIFDDYQAYLAANNLIDFSDMINIASQFIQEGRYTQAFDYVIIDEFQDTSVSRFRLVEALKLQNPYCKLFCVGDDWQSIYRFAGSDIALFREFEKYFGVTEKLKIETTYRYHEPLIKTSGDFIIKNPNQAAKALRSGQPDKTTTYEIVYYNNFEAGKGDLLKLDQLLQQLLQTVSDLGKKEIMLLGRYNFDTELFKRKNYPGSSTDEDDGAEMAEPVQTLSGTFRTGYDTQQREVVHYNSPAGKLTMPFLSVHRAKGMEADIVILLNCRAGKHGFPAQLSDDPVLNLLLSDADQFENGEERRLFYVAMTRAKERVYFLTDQVNKSKFIAELEVTKPESHVKKCPRCVEGDVVLKKSRKQDGTSSSFYGCTNFSFGCEYVKSANSTQH